MSTPGTQYALFESAEPMPVEQQVVAPADRRFSDYVVYVDESGDHSLASIDPDYPVFVLALCIFTSDITVKKSSLPLKNSNSTTSDMTAWCCTKTRFVSKKVISRF